MRFACVAGLVLGVVLAAGPVQAVDGCKAKISKKDGTIQISAKNVEGNPDQLLWGGASGEERNVFSNNATCVANGKAKNCTFGDPGQRLAITAPASCTVYLADTGMTTCSTYIKGCTPGTRPMWAVVASDGTLDRGMGVVSTTRFTTGNYEVIFDQSVSACSYVATLASVGEVVPVPGEVNAASRSGEDAGVYVRTHGSSGSETDEDFHLVVTCP